jgi:hypothetical protein
MAFPHHLDPPVQWAAAGSCGKLFAQGILEARDMVPQLLAAEPHAVNDPANPLTAHSPLPAASAILPCERFFGMLLVKRRIPVLISPGRTGKTSWLVTESASTAAGHHPRMSWVSGKGSRNTCSACVAQIGPARFEAPRGAT